MHEILDHLPADARVLDLGCRDGSFSADAYDFLVIRIDLNRPKTQPGTFIQADAVHLPFRSQCFDAVILNHGLEHFAVLKPALQEIGRVIRRDGAVYVAVPDATTLTDRVYRKLFADAGGHVNLFDSPAELEKNLAWYFGLPHTATRVLFSSMSFLNRKNTRAVRAQMRFGGFFEIGLLLLYAGTRLADRFLSTRTGIYGWAFYFGAAGENVDPHPLTNVCIRCGQAHPSQTLEDARRVRGWSLFKFYRCPDCATLNFFSRDRIDLERH